MNTETTAMTNVAAPRTSKAIIEHVNTIWEELQVLPNVREHQARVTAVVCALRDHWKLTSPTINWDDVLAAALLHDLGNIMKADLASAFSQHLLGPVECERLDFWLEQQAELRTQFGPNEIAVTIGLMLRAGANERLQELVRGADFTHNEATAQSTDWERKLLAHADHCVGPFSVLTLAARLAEGSKRYGYSGEEDSQRPVVRAAYDIMEQVQAHVVVPLDSITEEFVAHYIQRFLPRTE